MAEVKLEWHTEKRKIKDLVPTEGNPRQMTEKEAMDLKQSLKKFNLVDIPAINLDNRIISGHQRISILKIEGRENEEIDVRVPNRKLTEEEHKEYLLRANKNLGSWNYDLLANFSEEELNLVGFESEELDRIFNLDASEDDFDTETEYEKIKEPKVKLGDLYQLGSHKLLCGDSTQKEDVAKLMGGEKVDMVFTDPPYNVDYSSRGKLGKMKKDNQSPEEFLIFCEKFFERIKENLKDRKTFYICSDFKSYFQFVKSIYKNNLHYSNPIIWVKNQMSMGWQDYRSKHEMILKGKKQKTKMADVLIYGRNGESNEFYGGRDEADVWEVKRRASNTMVHPTQKPLELSGRAIRNSSKRGEMVLDLFGGSGSTLISAEKEGRKVYLCELDPIYCQVIIDRWEKFTGKTAIKLN